MSGQNSQGDSNEDHSPKVTYTCAPGDTLKTVHSNTLYIITKWKPHTCPSSVEWLNCSVYNKGK